MIVSLVHATEDYHKLVEATARECYQSYSKVSDKSERFVKGIMAKGHLSIASVGNLVFAIGSVESSDEYIRIITDLMKFKEINNYVRWTMPDDEKNPNTQHGIIVSMNLLTFMDIEDNYKEYQWHSSLFKSMKQLLLKLPDVSYFLDESTQPEPRANPFVQKTDPDFYQPVLWTEDYTKLAREGFTEYELDIHATITVNMMVDRATGLQSWRHSDMLGGTELSQRYVERDNAPLRDMLGFSVGEYPNKLDEHLKDVFDNEVRLFNRHLEESLTFYSNTVESLTLLGLPKGRAKEIARAGLPNAVATKIIQCRPLRQWKHFFKLRDSAHAQKEIQADTQQLKKLFVEAGIDLG